jgi:hypothetical protein
MQGSQEESELQETAAHNYDDSVIPLFLPAGQTPSTSCSNTYTNTNSRTQKSHTVFKVIKKNKNP